MPTGSWSIITSSNFHIYLYSNHFVTLMRYTNKINLFCIILEPNFSKLHISEKNINLIVLVCTFSCKGSVYPPFSFEGGWVLMNNIFHSPKGRWMVVNIYPAAKPRGKYPPLSPTPRWIIVLVYTTQAE